MKQKLFTLLTLLCFAVSGAWATDETVSWSGSSLAGTSGTNVTAGTATAVNGSTYKAGTISISSNKIVTESKKHTNDSYWEDFSSTPQTSTSTSPSGTARIEFPITVTTGYNFTVSEIDFTFEQGGGSGPAVHVFLVQGESSTWIGYTAAATKAYDGLSISLSEGSAKLVFVLGVASNLNNGRQFKLSGISIKGTSAVAATGDYTITKGSASNGSITVKGKADKDEVVDIEATPNTGYEFSTWTIHKTGDAGTTVDPDDASDATTTFTMPDYDVTVNATFTAINYAITHSDAANGTYTISVAGGLATDENTTANYGQTITLAATPADGYSLTSWGVTDEDDNAVTVTDNQFTMPAKAVTIAPTFAVIPDVTITTDLDDSYSMVINTKKTFTIAASGGTGTYTYQWYENDTESTAGATAISGKTSESYEINPTAAYDKYIYCVATSSAKSAISNIAHVTAAAITPSYKDFNSAETIVATTSANFATQLALSWMCDGNGGGSFTYSDNAYHKNGNVRVYPQLAKTTTEEIITAKAYDCVNVKKNIANNTLVTYVTGVSGVKAYTAPTGSSSRGVFIYAKENGTGDNVAEATASLNNTEKPLTYVTTLVGLDPEKNYAIYYVGVDNVSTNNPSNHMIAALKFNPTPDETFSLNSSGFATFSNQNSTAYSGATACKAALDYANSTITCTALTNNEAPAATGILLRGEASASVKVFYTGSNAVAGNNLHATTKADGTTEDMEVGYLYYVLSGDTFKKYTGAALAANKAFFKVDESTEVVSGKEWSIVFEDENGDVTGIKKVNGSQLNIDTYYDLSGRKVAQPTKGLYIVNGRKVIVK